MGPTRNPRRGAARRVWIAALAFFAVATALAPHMRSSLLGVSGTSPYALPELPEVSGRTEAASRAHEPGSEPPGAQERGASRATPDLASHASPRAPRTGSKHPGTRDGFAALFDPSRAVSYAPLPRAMDGSSEAAAPAYAETNRSDGSLVLFRLEWAVGQDAGAGERLVGYDRSAPRPLVLWEVDARTGLAAEVARTTSHETGRILTDGLLLPARSFALVAAPTGADPFSASASEPLAVAPLPLEPPQAWLESNGDPATPAPRALAVVAEGAGFTLVIGDEEGRALGVLAVPAPSIARSGPRVLRFTVDEAARNVARMLPDGRLSTWRAIGVRDAG